MTNLNPDTIAELVATYEAEQVTATALAARYGLDYDTVRDALREAGVALRVSGFRLVPRPDVEQTAAIVRRYRDEGASVAELAADSGFSQKIVKGVLRDAGVLQIGRRRSNAYPNAVTLVRLAVEYGRDGVTVKELAAREQFKPRVLAQALAQAGVEIQPHRGSTPNRAFDAAIRREIAAAYQAGTGLTELQRRYRCGVARLYEVLAAEGVETRRRGRPAKPQAQRPERHPDNPSRDRKVRTLDVCELLAAGVLLSGPVEMHYKGETFAGELQADGKVRLADGSVRALGGATHFLIGRWESGYLTWHGRTPSGELASINTIRNRYLAALAAQEQS